MTATNIGADRNASLLDWYLTQARDLPWRRTTNPYEVLVSEVMLQQTQVSRVVPKFDEFIGLWPTVEDLSGAETDVLLAAWSGLGYNSRALRLREAARAVAKHGWPETVEGLRRLDGVGPYTAAAVASICFGAKVAAVDTNLTRVLSRWAGEALAGEELALYAAGHVADSAGDWNQALMDLGSSMCVRRNPHCGDCPVARWCSDPTIYSAPTRQSRFEGSRRQLRGALLRAHLAGEDLEEASRAIGRTPDETTSVIATLQSEGLLPT